MAPAASPLPTCQSMASQTDDLWPPTPYEHLFFSVLPPSLLHPQPTPTPAGETVTSPARPVAPAELLDRYIDAAFRNHERQAALHGQGRSGADDVALLRGQVRRPFHPTAQLSVSGLTKETLLWKPSLT